MKHLVSPLLIGREAEMSVLAEAFDEAGRGRQRTVLVGAEAGGGKSRLVRDFCEQVRNQSCVLVGWCVEQGEPGLSFAPFVSMVREIVRSRGSAGVVELVGRENARELGRLIPALGPAPQDGDSGAARSRFFEAMRCLLEALASVGTVVAVLEDLHWADRGTRDLLAYLARNLPHTRLLLVASHRTEGFGSQSLRRSLAELCRIENVTAIVLRRLSKGEVATQLSGMLGREAAPDVVAAVYQRGAGVPLFTELMIAQDGSARTDIPGSVRDLLLGTLDELPERAREVLRGMSAGGQRVGHGLLASVVGSDDLEASLRVAAECNLVVADGDDAYAFRHALIRDAIRDDLLPGERARLHRKYAEILETDPSLASDGWVAGALALHWRAAGDIARSLGAAWRAGQDAAERLAYAEQLSMLELVLDLWPQASSAARALGVEYVRVLERTADAACWAVEPVRGQRWVETALAELNSETDGARVASMLIQRAMMRQQQMHPGEIDDLRAALDLSAPDTPLRAETLGQLCRALYLHGRAAEGRRWSDELCSLAKRLADPEWKVEAHVARVLSRSKWDDQAVELLESSVRDAQQSGSGRVEMIVRVALTDALDARGRHADAAAAARVGWQRAQHLGQARYMGATVAYWLAHSLWAIGAWDEANDVIEEALALDPSPLGRAQLCMVRGAIACARGNLATAADCLQALEDIRAPQDAARRASVGVELSVGINLARGDPAAAAAACQQIQRLRGDLSPRELWPLIAAGWRTYSEGGETEGLRDLLLETSEGLARPSVVEEAYASMSYAEGSGEAGDADPEAWASAVSAWERAGRPHALAYASMRQGGALLGSRERARAAAALRRAARLARELGSAPIETRVAALARRARIPLWPDETGSTPTSQFDLTPRELEVLSLVAAGRSNQEIAAALFITAKTASVHVSNILAKLEVPSRSAAAAAAHRSQLIRD